MELHLKSGDAAMQLHIEAMGLPLCIYGDTRIADTHIPVRSQFETYFN